MYNLRKNIILFSISVILAGFASAGDKLVGGNWYSIKSDNNMWVSYDKESKNFKLKNAELKSRFRAIEKPNNKFLFQLADKEYLSASDDSTVTIREKPWGWETFTVEETPDHKYYLRSLHGNYLSINYHKYELDLSSNRGGWEAIEFVKGAPKLNNGEQFFIKGPDGKFLSLGSDSKKIISAEANRKAVFSIIARPDNKIVLLISPQEYLSASDDGTVTIRENPWGWETFTPKEASGGKIFLKSFFNNYVSLNPENNSLDLVSAPDKSAEFEFIPAVFEMLKEEHLGPKHLNIQDAVNLLMASKPQLAGRQIIVLNTEPAIYGEFPKSTFIRDYESQGALFQGFMYAKLDGVFMHNLPESVQQQLKMYNLYDPTKVDIFFIAQAAENDSNILIGKNGDQSFTLLSAHAWADTELPYYFEGDRLKRDYLFGLFEAEPGVADEVPLGSLAPFQVHVHDNGLSPRTARIKIDHTKSYGFYSVVIGKVFPSNEMRANVTYHWILNRSNSRAFRNETLARIFYTDTGKTVRIPFLEARSYAKLNPTAIPQKDIVIVPDTMREFLVRINNDPTFRGTGLHTGLNALMGFVH